MKLCSAQSATVRVTTGAFCIVHTRDSRLRAARTLRPCTSEHHPQVSNKRRGPARERDPPVRSRRARFLPRYPAAHLSRADDAHCIRDLVLSSVDFSAVRLFDSAAGRSAAHSSSRSQRFPFPVRHGPVPAHVPRRAHTRHGRARRLAGLGAPPMYAAVPHRGSAGRGGVFEGASCSAHVAAGERLPQTSVQAHIRLIVHLRNDLA